MMPTLSDRLSKPFWSLADIRVCLKMPYKVAKRVLTQAQALDAEEMNGFIVYDTKARRSSVLAVTHLSLDQIKNAFPTDQGKNASE